MWQQQAACGLRVKCLIGPRRILAWRPFESWGNWAGKDVEAFCLFMSEQEGVVEEEAAAEEEEAVHAEVNACEKQSSWHSRTLSNQISVHPQNCTAALRHLNFPLNFFQIKHNTEKQFKMKCQSHAGSLR